ncbi:DUF748 domain-containing protein [Alteromonas sp. 5E99-2]|uniref:DUF748 domain-containing protein n=1 Tax=Alteromonas sp. 5E99-2 TaxID=2817683 RepID=UPI001A99D017|nr:DUF748 domain-containing protein [Alteromonas sp. 5E99-2]MBO1254434.1 DUF748 domain-containing protein [Alteromonas sp. 5E99-2]
MKLFGRIVIWSFAIVIALGLLVWALSPVVSRPIIGNILKDKGLVLHEDSSIRLNPFRSRLTISNLSWLQKDNTVFELDTLAVDYSLWKAVFAKVHINEIFIEGVYAHVKQSDNVLSVLGIMLNEEAKQDDAITDEANTTNTSDTSEIAIDVALVKATFKDIHLEYEAELQNHNIGINLFEINDVAFDGTHFSLNSSANITFSSSISDADINFNFATSLVLKGSLGDVIHAELGDLTTEFSNLSYKDKDYQATLGLFEVNVPEASASIGDDIQVSSLVSVEMSSLSAQHTGGITLAKISALQLPQLIVNNTNNVVSAKWDSFVIDESQFLVDSDNQQMASFKALSFNQFSGEFDLNKGVSDLSLDTVALDQLIANITVDQSGSIAAIDAISATEPDNDNQAEAEAEAEAENNTDEKVKDSVFFNVNTIALTSPAKIHFEDQSISPLFDKNIEISTLSIDNINNKDNNESAEFLLSLKDEDYFSYQIDGSAQPFGEKLNLILNSNIKELAVHEVSPYLHTALGFGVEAGQLDSEASITVADNALDGTLKLNLRGATFTSNKAKEEDELDMVGQAAIPLNVALGMLKDNDGNINLTIPVNGDVDDPSFGVQYIIGLVVKKAVMNQTKKHLINTFVPYGQILSIAYSAGTYALKVRFEDLVYEPKQTALNESQLTFVDQFVALMEKKPDIQVNVCPIASTSELDETIGKETITKDQKQRLVEIAKERGDEFKRQVTEQGVDSARILLCSPEIDFSQKSLPRISLSV